MTREKTYLNTKFPPDVIASVLKDIRQFDSEEEVSGPLRTVQVADNEKWGFASDDEFFEEYRKDISYADYRATWKKARLSVTFYGTGTTVEIEGVNRLSVLALARHFEDAVSRSKIDPKKQTSVPTVFIGHGRSELWRDLKDHLHEAHGLPIEAYEVGSRAGHAIRDILEEMLRQSSLALLVMTAEDHDVAGGLHARENVIHELGLFQGHLGFSKAIILLEEGTHEFSNIHGIHQLRFSKGNIKEIFGEVLAVLRREFGNVE